MIHTVRHSNNLMKGKIFMNIVLIIPTGIGCEIGGHAGDANPVANEVWCVIGANDPFAKRADQEAFQKIENLRISFFYSDQFNQMHITWWIKKVQTEKTVMDFPG